MNAKVKYEVVVFLRNIFAKLSIIIQNKLIVNIFPPTPKQLRVFYIGGYWRGQNDMVAQMLSGLRATEVNVVDFNTDKNHDALDTDGMPYDRGTTSPVWLRREKLFPLIFRFRPHIVICNAGGLSFRSTDSEYLRKKLGIKLLTFVLSDPEVYIPTTSKIAHNFDVLYSFVNQYVELYKKQVPDSYLLPMATNKEFFHPVPARKEYECDVLMIGAVHVDRIEPVKLLVQNFNTNVHGENWENYDIENKGIIYEEDVLAALNSTKMAVIFSKSVTGFQGFKVGILDFLAAGCLVITEETPHLHVYFEVGKEVVAFTDYADMIVKIKYYLSHPDEAEQILKAGREKVINRYTWEKIWPKVLATTITIHGWNKDTNWIEGYIPAYRNLP